MVNIQKTYFKHRETITNFSWRTLQVFIKGIVSLFILFVAAKFLSPEKFGVFNYITAVFALIIVFCDFGISTATSRYVAEYKIGSPEKINKVIFSVLSVLFCASFIFSALLVILGKPLFKENYTIILLFIPYLFFFPMTSVLDGFYRGLKEFRKLALIYLSSGTLVAIASFFLIKNLFLAGALLSLNALYFISALLLLIFRKERGFSFDKNVIKDILKYGALVGFANIAYFLYTKADILILKQFGYVTEIGYYSIVITLFNILFIPSLILGQVIAPNMIGYISKKNYSIVKERFIKSSFAIIALSLPISFFIYLIVPVGLRLLLPNYYTPIFIMIFNVMILLLPFKIWGSYTVQGFITPCGYVKIITILTFVSGILNVVFDYISIWFFGFIGVFYTTLIIHSATIMIGGFLFYKRIESLAVHNEIGS